MAKPTVFIDGSHGTTGLRIQDRLENRPDLELLSISEEDRRDTEVRRAAYEDADLAILCLPDDAALEAADWAEETNTRVIDASTAHRVDDNWVFGLPEMVDGQRESIRESPRVSNPGCYATAVILGMRPLVDDSLIPADFPLTVHALSGYTGGGKKMIARWEGGEPGLTNLPFETPYAIEARHKHIPEMTKYSGLEHAPQFIPSVGPFATGMRLELPLHSSLLGSGADADSIWQSLDRRYAGEQFIRVIPMDEAAEYSDPAFDPRACNDTNRLDISVLPNVLGHVLIVVQLDNLGKGASGAAVQNMNLMLGVDESEGLTVS